MSSSKIKAAFFDIDGTLISFRDKTVSPSTAQAIRQLRARGILTFVATGRSRPEIEAQDMLHGMPFDAVLSNNGHLCYAEERILRDVPLDKADVAALVRYVEQTGCPAWFTERDRLYISSVNDRVRRVMADIHTQIPPVADFHRALSQPIYKVVFYLTPEEMAQGPARVVQHSVPLMFHPFASDFTPMGGGKEGAMLALLQQFGLSPQEVIAFGDGENDTQMLALAGIGVAMGNAAPHLKELADYVTDTCENDGIRKALEHFDIL